jgi:hypothetical protein
MVEEVGAGEKHPGTGKEMGSQDRVSRLQMEK